MDFIILKSIFWMPGHKNHIKNAVIFSQCKSITDPVPTSNFYWFHMLKVLNISQYKIYS